MENEFYLWSDSIVSTVKRLGLPPLPFDLPFVQLNLLDLSNIPVPSTYLGRDFELDQSMIADLKTECNITDGRWNMLFRSSKEKYELQSNFEHNSTDLNIFFVDWLLDSRPNGYSIDNYFDYEFWRKPSAMRNTFIGEGHRVSIRMNTNMLGSIRLLKNKALFHQTYGEFVRRDWLDLTDCTINDFKTFADRHPRFFIKDKGGSLGEGAAVIDAAEVDLDAQFAACRRRKMIAEEIIRQHPDIASFCPDSVNTIRVNTFLDHHDKVHILTTSARFGRVGNIIDNFHGGGFAAIVDPLTGVITSDALNAAHERFERHPDTDKVFCGFQYPHWAMMRQTVMEMARRVSSLRHVGWDVSITNDNRIELVEGNHNPDTDVQQAADSIGRLHLYKSLMDDYARYKTEHLKILGYRVNHVRNLDEAYQMIESNRRNRRVPFALENLIDGCQSLLDVGCRRTQYGKRVCPSGVEYYSADFDCHNKGTIECDFNAGQFPALEVDTAMSIYTAEFVEMLPEFLRNMCRAARRQVLMVCRPIDRETNYPYRWAHPFVVDFTEGFLIESMGREGFHLRSLRPHHDNSAIVLYDFRR